jgi:hypothetical protein
MFILAGKYFRLTPDHQQTLEPVTAEPVKLALESFPVLAHAAADQVRDGFAFDAEKVLQARHGIVARLQRSPDRGQPLEGQRILFPGVDHDHRRTVGQLAQGSQRRETKRPVFVPTPLPRQAALP